MNRTRKPLLAIALILIGAASYGLMSSVFKLAVAEGLNVNALTLAQVLFGAVMLWLMLGIQRYRRKAAAISGTRKAWVLLSVIGVVGMSLTTIFYNEALARLDASLGIVLLFQFTWITLLLESIRKRKWPIKAEWISVVCILLGTILAVGMINQDLSDLNGLGVLFGLLSAVTYSLFFFLAAFLSESLDPIEKSVTMSSASFVFVLLLQAPTLLAISFSGPLLGWGLLLGLLGTALPFVCFNYGIPKVGSSLAALLGSMELPAAVIAAYLLLDEPFTLWQGTGIILIVAGIMAAQRKLPADSSGKEGEK